MNYTEFVAIILGVSLVFYMLFGGADFGAGIIELFMGNRGNKTISKAIAPVWEANHIWLIIALVILFNGFPQAYAIFSTALHIPILLFLIGIIFRGAAFTFRHYDAFHDRSQRVYSWIFRYSSLFSVFFLGITLGALLSGTLPAEASGSFARYYLSPWMNGFTLSMGLFLVILSAYIAAIFLLGEAETEDFYLEVRKLAIRMLIASVLSGLAIFFFSWKLQLSFHSRFMSHPVAITGAVMATVLAPFILNAIFTRKIWRLRVLCSGQILLIVMCMFIVQWPDLIVFSDGTTLTIQEATASEMTMKVLFIALITGVGLIFPALYYLFRVFKSTPTKS